MSKHTPGPWVAIARTNAHISIEAPEQPGYVAKAVATVSMNNHEDNARLIAAAPDLLEALRIAREIVVTARNSAHQGVVNPSTGVIDDSDDADWVAEYDCALAQIDTAIAKATGEKA